MTRFPIRYTGANHAMVVLGLTPGNSRVEVFEDRIEVRMGWAFRATIDRELDPRRSPTTTTG